MNINLSSIVLSLKITCVVYILEPVILPIIIRIKTDIFYYYFRLFDIDNTWSRLSFQPEILKTVLVIFQVMKVFKFLRDIASKKSRQLSHEKN